MKAAIIVAHPDDEIIWCGGLILKHPEWDRTVLSLSRCAGNTPSLLELRSAFGLPPFQQRS